MARNNSAPKTMIWLWRVLKLCAAALALAALWIVLGVYAEFTEPSGNRAYAETWIHAPVSELLQVQGQPDEIVERPNGVAGKIYSYSFNGWRGMKGRFYPGTILGKFADNRRMQSRVLFVTPASGSFCDIGFAANSAGLIEAITYSGNDCS